MNISPLYYCMHIPASGCYIFKKKFIGNGLHKETSQNINNNTRTYIPFLIIKITDI